MKLPWAAASIRLRLTAWYTAAIAVMLILYATATFVAVRHEFLEQLDGQLHEDFETAEAQLVRTPDGRISWGVARHHDLDDDEGRVYEVWSQTGEQIHRSGSLARLPPVALASLGVRYRYDTITADGDHWRTITAPVSLGNHAVVMRVSRSQRRLRNQLWEILVVLVLGLPLVVALAGVGGYLLARRALAPIDRLASAARRITAQRLHERLTVANPADEIGRLTVVINDTIARLESSFDQLRRFTADASHELRTPLAVVRGIGEAAVAAPRSAEEYEEAIGSMLEEVDRMTNLVDALLRLSHGDTGGVRLSRKRLDLGQLAREVASSLGILAEERSQKVTLDTADGLLVSCDRLVLREAIANVLDNAIKYGPVGSTVTIRAQRLDSQALLAIVDEGPGIPAEHRERVFHRFFRVDEARSRDRGGAGLGLAIAKWAVEIHGGQITVSERDGGGAEFRILLPLAQRVEVPDEQRTTEVRVGGYS
jgi:heavy metal sensor kinase